MNPQSHRTRTTKVLGTCAILLAMLCLAALPGRADEPYARSRDYDLRNVRTHLWFDTAARSIRGEVSENISLLRDGIEQVQFDSVDLDIRSVTLDGKDAKFTTASGKLVVPLAHPGKIGDTHEIAIRYDGKPRKGVYFVLPDKDYPQRPAEVWTQGESEDTRYYIPIYDYPNDRTTSEMLLTVPANWTTVSNGQLAGIRSESDGTKTWDWKQTEPLSTYLISAVAGEFVEHKDTWRGVTVRYVVPRGDEAKIDPTFARTKEMLSLFSDKLGVKYPWPQYAQSSVDDFVEGGMENTSATTLTTRGLVNPQLAAEMHTGSDSLNSHELAHQWFGDLVTCKDWANLWLNEGFATYFQHYWIEQHYGADDAAYEFWRDQSQWFGSKRLYPVPIVNRNFSDSLDYAGNIYTKAGWVLKMLHEQLGDQDFFLGLHHYLEVNRGQNVVTADLQKALEQATSRNVDEFFYQWLYRAGAPEFEVHYTYDDAAHQVNLTVQQNQEVAGLVGLFRIPIEIEIATASGNKTYPIDVSKASETFTLPADGAPRMVLFDKGDAILKTLKFEKDPVAWMYQLKNAETVTDRADAAVALGDVKENDEVTAALGVAALHDPFWGVRNESLRALGKIGGAAAENQIIAALANEQPWVRQVAVTQLGQFKNDAALGPKLTDIAANDKAWTVRGAALGALAEIKAPNAFDTLAAAVKTESPDSMIRNAALRGLGTLGDDRGVPLVLDWSALGKPFETRRAAISALANLDKSNTDLTKTLISYLREPYFDIQYAALSALGRRGDVTAIAPLEALVQSGDLSPGTGPIVQREIDALKGKAAGKKPDGASETQAGAAAGAMNDQEALLQQMAKLERQMEQLNQRVAGIESQLAAPKK